MKNKLLTLFLSVLSVFFIFSGKVSAADKISIVSDTAYAPFEFKDSDQTYKGIDVDIIKEVAKRSGWDYKQTYPGFDAAVNAVQSGQADALMAGTTVTEARKKVFKFSDTYYDTSIVVYTKTGTTSISDYNQLKGKTVGVKNGTAAQTWLDQHASQYGYTVKTFDTSDLMNNSLDQGNIDAAMDDKPVVQYAISQGKKYDMSMDGESVGSFAFAVKKGSKQEYLIDDFNKALADMKKDGTYDKIMKKWLGDTVNENSKNPSSSLKLTGDAKAKASPVKDTYTIALDSSFAPFEYQNGSGKYVGIDVELIKAIAKQQGFKVKFQYPGFDAALNAVKTGQADAVIAGMTITDERKQTFDFSDPYYSSNVIIAVTSDSKVAKYSDLKGQTIGAKKGTSSYDWLEQHADQYNYKVRAYDDGSTLYDSLQNGSIDALMDDEAVLKYTIKQGRKFKTPIKGEKSGNIGFAVKAGSNPELIQMFNNGLASLVESGQYDKIINKYLATEKEDKATDETTVVGLIQNNYKQLLQGLGITLGLTLLSFAIAMLIGILFGMMAVAPSKTLRTIAQVFVDVIRGIPLMIVAAFIYWGIPNLIESITGHQSPINDFLAATIALSLNGGAYIAEIVRGGIEAIPAGQMEASRSLGVPYRTTMRKVILPQAVRVMLPNFINQFVISLKDTTIVSAIGLVELFQTGKIIIARNYQSFRMYAILAIIYLVIITLLTRLAKRLERKLK
ncbi:ABC transporter substrate-binding protein/permease [Streptococcus dentapri]|uniref:ABC transporter substrate-binding protein/permease n=1 Tax=Streptococcus dentapri TaxID=573564 RepID=A0ABV8D1K6_9STRE